MDLGAWASEEYRIPEEPSLREGQKRLDGRDEEK